MSSTLRLEMRQGGLANPRWMALLGNIDDTHSITAAAKAAGLSYKAAWDAIDAMNNLAGKPVVATSVGGKGGGGARLTPHGRELLTTYRVIEVENEHFVAAMNARLGQAARSVQALGRLSMRTSARNQWAGKVARIRKGVVNDEVEIRLAGGDRIVAVVTRESTEHLGLAVGHEAFALVKASSVIVGKAGGARLRLSARNQLAGKITRVTPGAVSTEVVIGLRGSHTVAGVITNTSARELDLKVGQKAVAIIKASSVIIAAA
ncbi:MAG TPA: TOBE domain-containing protein [Steroidobacteraceae bacterium]